MFSRRPDRPKEEPRYGPPSGSARPTDLVAVPPSDQPGVWGAAPVPASSGGYRAVPAGAGAGDATVVAANDHVEGVLRSGQGVLVLGSFAGTIESESWIQVAESATVRADLMAMEIIVAGRFAGRILAKGRLEITPTGQIQGEIETPRLLLHEGGLIDGALSMTRKDPMRLGAPAPSDPGAAAAAPVAQAVPGAAQAQPVVPAKTSVRASGGPAVSPRSRGGPPVPVEAAAPAHAAGGPAAPAHAAGGPAAPAAPTLAQPAPEPAPEGSPRS